MKEKERLQYVCTRRIPCPLMFRVGTVCYCCNTDCPYHKAFLPCWTTGIYARWAAREAGREYKGKAAV